MAQHPLRCGAYEREWHNYGVLPLIYHISNENQWAADQAAGSIAPASLTDEGFVHCSFADQIPGTVAKHYPGETTLLVLEIDPELLDGELVVEDSYNSGNEFPHVYAAIETSAVRRTIELTVTDSGVVFPLD